MRLIVWQSACVYCISMLHPKNDLYSVAAAAILTVLCVLVWPRDVWLD